MLEGVLNEVVKVTEGGVTKRMSKKDLVLRMMVNKALKGDLRAVAQLFRLMGDLGISQPEFKTDGMVIKLVRPDKKEAQTLRDPVKENDPMNSGAK